MEWRQPEVTLIRGDFAKMSFETSPHVFVCSIFFSKRFKFKTPFVCSISLGVMLDVLIGVCVCVCNVFVLFGYIFGK